MTISRHAGHERLGRHRHADGYVALVLAGGYIEAGDGGRWRVEAGQAVIHEAHEAHQDIFPTAGAAVLNLPLTAGLSAGVGTVADPDRVARLAERDPLAAAAMLAADYHPGGQRLDDWPDQLAALLDRAPDTALTGWADAMGLDPASVSRGFVRVYGVSPKRFRLEARTRRALRMLSAWRGSVAALAADCGFADQAHFSRSVRALTGRTLYALMAKSVQA